MDENPLVLEMISRTLEPLGSTLLAARNGVNALKLVEERSSDLDVF